MSHKSYPAVSVIIPHWNGIEVLSECLDSLKQTTYPALEIIVVDNASTDDSSAWIEEHHPDIILIQNDKNYGYAGGCNRGISHTKGSFILFLNNDTIMEPGWIEPLVDRMMGNKKIAAVQPKILNYYQRKIFDYAGGSGGHLDVFCFPFARGRIFLEQEEDQGQYDNPEQIFWASGTAFIVQKELFQAAGEFDETFFAHMEEIDLCWRFQLMGYEIWAEPQSVVFHKNAVTLPMNSYKKYYLNHKNSLLMLLGNYSLPVAMYLFSIRFALEWVAFGYALFKLDFKHMLGIINAQVWLLFHPHVIWKKHFRTGSIRVKRDRSIMSRLYRGSIVLTHYIRRRNVYSEISSKPFV